MAFNLGVAGPLFEIKEQDVLMWIESRLLELEKSGETKKIETKLKEQVEGYVKRPTPVQGLSKTKNPRKYTFDPTVVAPFDLKDAKGKLFHKAGDKVNPLDTFELERAILFIDADDRTQLDWALAFEKTHQKESTLILVKGAVFELMKSLKRSLYFDQGGWLVKKFGIRQVPASVTQEGKVLVVEEVKLK